MATPKAWKIARGTGLRDNRAMSFADRKRCPSCKRWVFTRRDLLYAPLDGTAQCPACGRTARLDLLSRWVISCAIALILWNALLFGGVFYSGHLFLISIVLIFGIWRLLCAAVFPFITLESVADSPFDRRKSMLAMVALLVAAMVFDSFMARRFESEDLAESGRGPTAVNQQR
jgi:hypothetical protein